MTGRQSSAVDKALRLVRQGMTPYAAARKAGVSLTTIYRAIQRHKAKMPANGPKTAQETTSAKVATKVSTGPVGQQEWPIPGSPVELLPSPGPGKAWVWSADGWITIDITGDAGSGPKAGYVTPPASSPQSEPTPLPPAPAVESK